MNKKSFSFSNYLNWLLQKYKLVQNQLTTHAYRIVNVNTSNSNKNSKLEINIVGTCKAFECTPLEIAENDELLEGFSKKDIRTIIYLACANKQKSTFKISTQNYSETSKNIIFGIKNHYSGEYIEQTAQQISINKDLLSSLNPVEAHRIGFVLGCNSADFEKHKKLELKQSK